MPSEAPEVVLDRLPLPQGFTWVDQLVRVVREVKLSLSDEHAAQAYRQRRVYDIERRWILTEGSSK